MTGTRALLLLNPRARRGRDAGGDAAERLRELGPRTPATLAVIPRSLAVLCR
jgi:hypothetical protein